MVWAPASVCVRDLDWATWVYQIPDTARTHTHTQPLIFCAGWKQTAVSRKQAAAGAFGFFGTFGWTEFSFILKLHKHQSSTSVCKTRENECERAAKSSLRPGPACFDSTADEQTGGCRGKPPASPGSSYHHSCLCNQVEQEQVCSRSNTTSF